MSDPAIEILISFDEAMVREQVWPDGDGPEVITAQAVAEVMALSATRGAFLHDWDLAVGLSIGCRVNGEEAWVWRCGRYQRLIDPAVAP